MPSEKNEFLGLKMFYFIKLHLKICTERCFLPRALLKVQRVTFFVQTFSFFGIFRHILAYIWTKMELSGIRWNKMIRWDKFE